MWVKKGVLSTTPKLLVGFDSNLAQMFPRLGSCTFSVGISRGEPKGRQQQEMWAKKGVLSTTPKLLVGFHSNLAKMFPQVGSCVS